MGYIADMVINNTRYNVSQAFEYLTNRVSNLQLALLLDKAQSIVNQTYVGDVNIVPPRQPLNIFKLLTNATPDILAGYIKEGTAATYPKIESIRNSTMISRTINECLDQLKCEEERELKEYSQHHATA